MKTLLKVALLVGIPLVIMTAIGLALLAQGQTSDGQSTIAVGVIIAAVSGGSVIYQQENWSLPKQSLLHFGVMVLTVLPALLLSGWFVLNTLSDYLLVIGIFLAVGLLLWTIMYLVFAKLIPAVSKTKN